jgi:D-alanyl-lipoteichoic acid acyltransferase DltB (MBOAT superfamily)
MFKNPAGHSALSAFGGTLGFYGQIYFDFAGYSLMAIGVANMFGYFLPDNFNHPYRAASVVDFWRRWHISLSTWLRDYLYIPLGGNRGSKWMVYRNLFITMFLGGLWHGANWNFLLWGAIHGVALCVNHAWKAHPKSAEIGGRRSFLILAFLLTQAVVFLCWIPFRAQTFADTAVIFGKLLEIPLMVWKTTQPFPWLLALVPLMVDTWFVGSPVLMKKWAIPSNVLYYFAVAVALLMGLLFMHIGHTPFIYFQF